jgi:Spy/CpxP family protein refolding chaperone
MSSRALLLATVVLAAATAASAQYEGSGGRQGNADTRSVDERIEEFSKKLDLSDDQQAQVKSILQSAEAELKELRNASLSRREKVSRLREIGEETNSKIRALLNDEQKKKFDEMVKERKSQARSRRRRF